MQPEDDLGVEVEVVGVGHQVEVAESVHPVGAIAAVPLREVQAGQPVLEPGQDSVADVLVERHPAGAGTAGLDHPRAEHCVRVSRHQGRDDVLDALGCVLPVTVEEDDHVEAPFDRPCVAGLLVSPVAEVAVVPHDRERQGGPVLELQSDLVGAVGAGVVTHQDVVDCLDEGVRQPRQGVRESAGRVVRDHEHADAQSRAVPRGVLSVRMCDVLWLPGSRRHDVLSLFRSATSAACAATPK